MNGKISFLNDDNRVRLAGSVLTGIWRDKNSINGACTAEEANKTMLSSLEKKPPYWQCSVPTAGGGSCRQTKVLK